MRETPLASVFTTWISGGLPVGVNRRSARQRGQGVSHESRMFGLYRLRAATGSSQPAQFRGAVVDSVDHTQSLAQTGTSAMEDLFQPKALITRLILGVIAAAALPADSKPLRREATHSARHDRRHGRYVGPVCRTINQGRSRPCPCGSGKKYKRCHLAIDVAERVRMSGKSRATGLRLKAA